MNGHKDAAPTPLTAEEKLSRLRLIRTENVGPVTFRHLLARYGSARQALKMLPELSRRGGRRKPLIAYAEKAARAELAALKRLEGEIIVFGDVSYPRALAATEDAPPVLFALGHRSLLEKPCFAIVGARNASAVGLRLARHMAQALGQAGYVLISGMARGIDAAVHEGALSSGTVAVLAGGVDVPYPRENEPLYHQIRETGLLLSEMPLGIQPQARHFPRRNRIISGLSLGLLVVEATHKSGSLITARLALEQGREVFAIPGSPLDPRAKGPNSLIRQGAVLTETADDILDVLHLQQDRIIGEPDMDHFTPPPWSDPEEKDLHNARLVIREKLSHTPVQIDELIRQTALPPAVLHTVLLELELAGEIVRHPGNRVAFC
tara:strand:+ start:40821 stop:41954 length:1134 start_codon:yes stop_codon:yes gene_type:complete